MNVVLRDTGDPTRPVLTLARLSSTPQIEEAVQEKLGQQFPGLGGMVEVIPLGQSSILTVKASAASGADAARIANAWANVIVERRSAQFNAELTETLARLRSQLEAIPATSEIAATVSACGSASTSSRHSRGAPIRPFRLRVALSCHSARSGHDRSFRWPSPSSSCRRARSRACPRAPDAPSDSGGRAASFTPPSHPRPRSPAFSAGDSPQRHLAESASSPGMGELSHAAREPRRRLPGLVPCAPFSSQAQCPAKARP